MGHEDGREGMTDIGEGMSYAVAARRYDPFDGPDDFPTPPWATRALCEHVLIDYDLTKQSVWEPACGRGYMSRTLEEYFAQVTETDLFDYGRGGLCNFLDFDCDIKKHDWIITNPPFKHAEKFIRKAFEYAQTGVAMLVRTSFLEGVNRYKTIFGDFDTRPTIVAQFSERVPMVKGRVDRKASTATSYCWIVWELERHPTCVQMDWIEPCRKLLERDDDYELPTKLIDSRK